MQVQNMGNVQQTASVPGQQPRMATPPVVITTKDLLFLRDTMSWMLLATKKCAHYARECTDPNVRQAIDQIGQLHQRHYNMLLSHCGNNNMQAMASVPKPQQTQ